MTNKEQTMNAHNAIAKQYYELYKDDKSDLSYFDEFLSTCEKKVLDLGCGMGHYSKYMKSKGFDVVGVDFSKQMIKIAKKTCPKTKFHVADICDLKVLKKEKFDGVVLAYVIQHLSKAEVEHVIKNLDKNLNPSAKMLLFVREGDQVLTEEEPIDTSFQYIINEYTQKEITELLNKYGWNVTFAQKKPKVNDPYSLAPDTMVVIAERRL
ncbi:MAG: class I SAM-dependent methyltransferase [Clostridia bacterium]|nr:class I SAM-dependent methyltransferase [Clostridia bacterium]